MAIGGYLYSGCSVVRGTKTIAQFSLDIHKCRVKAFIDSCARSNCGWSISRNEGTVDLDSTHQGCIYAISSTGSTGGGYATYFNYKQTPSSEPSCYFLILTLPNWGIITTSDGRYSSSVSNVVNVHANNMLWDYYNATSSMLLRSMFKGATCFSSMSLSDFGNHPSSETYIPSDAIRLTPIAATSYNSASNYSDSISDLYYQTIGVSETDVAIVTAASMSFGYATKSGRSDIEEFVKYGNTADSSGWHVNLYSDNMINQNVDSSDTYKLCAIKPLSDVRSWSGADAPSSKEWIKSSAVTMQTKHMSMLRDDGSLSWGVYGLSKIANVFLGVSALPLADTNTNRVYSPYLFGSSNYNRNGYYSKGFSNVEFLAFSWQSASTFAFTSDGNYLCIGNSGTWGIPAYGYTWNSSVYTYIGWDNTNPTLDSLNACPLYQPE